MSDIKADAATVLLAMEYVDDGEEAMYESGLAALARIVKAAEKGAHAIVELEYTLDRGDHLVYYHEWKAFDRWQRGLAVPPVQGDRRPTFPPQDQWAEEQAGRPSVQGDTE